MLLFTTLHWLGYVSFIHQGLAVNVAAAPDMKSQSPFQAGSMDFKSYAALGDSYSAGINAMKGGELPICTGKNGPYCTTRDCAKNKGAYSWQFDHLSGGRPENYTFLACSGADTTECLKSQVPQIPHGTDLVSITIGGNNGNAFADVVRDCIYIPGQFGCKNALEKAADVVNGIEPYLSVLFDQIRLAAPTAKIVVLGYVRFWPSKNIESKCQSKSLKRPSSEQKIKMNGLVEKMNKNLATVAAAHEVLWADPDPSFDGHRLCDVNEPFIQWDLSVLPGYDDGDNDGIRDPNADLWNWGVFHPTFDGQARYLNAFVRSLQVDGAEGYISNINLEL